VLVTRCFDFIFIPLPPLLPMCWLSLFVCRTNTCLLGGGVVGECVGVENNITACCRAYLIIFVAL
jgi:hypothetical protein